MKHKITRKDPDYEDWAVKLNGEYVQHAAVVSADAITGTVVRNVLSSNGDITDDEETVTGMVRLIERNEAVRAKEPAAVRVVQKGKGKKKAPPATEPENTAPAQDVEEGGESDDKTTKGSYLSRKARKG